RRLHLPEARARPRRTRGADAGGGATRVRRGRGRRQRRRGRAGGGRARGARPHAGHARRGGRAGGPRRTRPRRRRRPRPHARRTCSMSTLAVRLDNDGDVLLTGPAVRALAATDDVDMLAGPSGIGAARLLPGVRDVLLTDAPWSGYRPPPVDRDVLARLVDTLAARRYDRAVVFTSFHQSPLPMALLAKLAGIPYVAATCVDYPGSLLDLRHRRPDGLHEAEAALDLARAAGAEPPPGDDGRLALRRRSAPRWSPSSPRSCRRRAGRPTACRWSSSVTRPRRAAAPGPASARCPDTPVSRASQRSGWSRPSGRSSRRR